MTTMNWELLAGKYWKPTPNKEYIIEIGDWKIERHQFGDKNKPGEFALILNVYSVSMDGTITNYTEPKEFATCNRSFTEAMKPLIEEAIAQRKDRIYIQLKKTDKVYSVFSWRPQLHRQ